MCLQEERSLFHALKRMIVVFLFLPPPNFLTAAIVLLFLLFLEVGNQRTRKAHKTKERGLER